MVPLHSIVAAINMDTVAIHPAGTPVAVMGRGLPPLDAAIDATVAAMGRRSTMTRRRPSWSAARTAGR